MLAALIAILCAVSGALCVAVVTLPDAKLGDSVTLPCKHRDHTDTPVEQLDVQWWLGKQLVSRLDRGRISYGISYRNRTELPAGGASHGDFSLTITHTQHGDSGVYRCVIRREEQEDTLGEVQLRVEVPRSPSAVFVKVGEEVVLPCFGRVDWLDSEAELVRWKKGDQVVLQWEKGSLHVDLQFTGRASLLKEGILKDDLSLVLKNTLHEDQGHYLCFFVKNQKIQPAAEGNLTVTDHLTRVEAGSGSSVLLPLHSAAAVSVWFLPDGGNDTVCVCEVEEDQLKCEVGGTILHTHHTVLHNASLKLEKLSLLDSGTFSVMERGSQRTVSVLVLQVFPTGHTVVNADSAAVLLIVVTLTVVLGMSLATVVITVKRRRQRRLTLEQESEERRLNHADATSSKESITKQSVSSVL